MKPEGWWETIHIRQFFENKHDKNIQKHAGFTFSGTHFGGNQTMQMYGTTFEGWDPWKKSIALFGAQCPMMTLKPGFQGSQEGWGTWNMSGCVYIQTVLVKNMLVLLKTQKRSGMVQNYIVYRAQMKIRNGYCLTRSIFHTTKAFRAVGRNKLNATNFGHAMPVNLQHKYDDTWILISVSSIQHLRWWDVL